MIDAYITLENGLLLFVLFLGVSSLVRLMETKHSTMTETIRQQIETARRKRIAEELQIERERLKQEQIQHRQDQLERIRAGKAS